jgi:hypothetical protein
VQQLFQSGLPPRDDDVVHQLGCSL